MKLNLGISSRMSDVDHYPVKITMGKKNESCPLLIAMEGLFLLQTGYPQRGVHYKSGQLVIIGVDIV